MCCLGTTRRFGRSISGYLRKRPSIGRCQCRMQECDSKRRQVGVWVGGCAGGGGGGLLMEPLLPCTLGNVERVIGDGVRLSRTIVNPEDSTETPASLARRWRAMCELEAVAVGVGRGRYTRIVADNSDRDAKEGRSTWRIYCTSISNPPGGLHQQPGQLECTCCCLVTQSPALRLFEADMHA